jgi:hypothetical protein
MCAVIAIVRHKMRGLQIQPLSGAVKWALAWVRSLATIAVQERRDSVQSHTAFYDRPASFDGRGTDMGTNVPS